MTVTESAALGERASGRATSRQPLGLVPGRAVGIFLALDRYRQDPAWCQGALRVGQGWSPHGERRGSLPSPRLPQLVPGMLRRRGVPAVACRKGYWKCQPLWGPAAGLSAACPTEPPGSCGGGCDPCFDVFGVPAAFI